MATRESNVLTTYPKEASPVRTPPLSMLGLLKARADAAGDPRLCQRQTIERYHGNSTRPYQTLARISQGEVWTVWAPI